MANVILTNSGYASAPEPDPPAEGVPQMADEYVFPRYYFRKDEPAGRIFQTQEELDAAGGRAVWKLTPTEVTEDAQAPAPPPPAAPEAEDEPPTRRSHR